MMSVRIDFGFPAPRSRDTVDDLIELWQRARTVAENTPACPCHGIVPGFVDPDIMEDNMLKPLRARYRDNGQHALLALIEQRLRKSPFAGMRQPFPRWLDHLRGMSLDVEERRIFYADLAAALRSYADAASGFNCA
jgi:hypothetical protein